ncbi:hypothetical protein [Kamptonema formosum]|uniref:hypothetical protein n=1 Tax=Kamptonema formosum TaxID=331992 RepID=UPI0003723527|nr:hypothetical protein [Oscillatoria sp. PCC 10802]
MTVLRPTHKQELPNPQSAQRELTNQSQLPKKYKRIWELFDCLALNIVGFWVNPYLSLWLSLIWLLLSWIIEDIAEKRRAGERKKTGVPALALYLALLAGTPILTFQLLSQNPTEQLKQ